MGWLRITYLMLFGYATGHFQTLKLLCTCIGAYLYLVLLFYEFAMQKLQLLHTCKNGIAVRIALVFNTSPGRSSDLQN